MRIFLSCLFGGLLLAQTRPAPPIPKYEVKRAESPIVVDGRLDDKAWAAANSAELTFPWESQTGAKQKTVARLLWDDDNLYVSYDCEDADMRGGTPKRSLAANQSTIPHAIHHPHFGSPKAPNPQPTPAPLTVLICPAPTLCNLVSLALAVQADKVRRA